MARTVKILTPQALEKLSTQRLLAYLKKLHQCEESFEKSDWDLNTDLTSPDTIQYKQTEKWKLTYQKVKSILKDREHLEK